MRKIIMAMAALLLFATGCGDDSSGGRFDTATGDSSDIAGDASPSGGSGEDDGGGAVGAGSSTDFCRFITQIDEDTDDVGDEFGSVTAEDLESAYDRIDGVIDQAVRTAPGEIRDDVEFMAGAFRDFRDLLSEYDYDVFAMMTDPAIESDSRFQTFDGGEFDAANERVNAFCGIEPDPGLDTDEPGTDVGGGDVEGVPDFSDAELMDTDFLVQIYQEAFGWDEELARCVVEELGLEDPTGALDPSVFSDPNGEICGRTFAELFSGG